ncbi:acetyl esterase [Hypericibacter adhaerens]|jgi:acetyl esterase|uniref:Acetyl esterase n=2 Tax=Hypericibacter adhaerens TaxID=2602016 RepID=A0A5J6N4R1_9PROT|nr:acetyl esterase [Hypericibacter adhaerens]
MDIRHRLDPEMKAALVESQRLYGSQVLDWRDLATMREAYERERRFWNREGPALAEVKDFAIPGPYGSIPLRLLRPARDKLLPALVFLHGGGYVLGNLDTHDRIMRLLAAKSGAAVLGIDYRLAPEHKFPTQLDEIAATLDWLTKEGRGVGVDAVRLALGGDSAGAHLSLGTAVGLQGKPPAIKALLLYYGSYGLADSMSMRLCANDLDGVKPSDLAFYRDSYVRGPRDHEDRRLDCLAADLAGLPPAYILALEFDTLRDDSLTLAELLGRAGVPCRLTRHDGVLHGYLHYNRMIPKAMQAIEEGAAALRDWLF